MQERKDLPPLLDGHVTHKPLGNPLLPYGTPQHVAELVMLILKLTFEELPDKHPYRFRQDINQTGILFDVHLNKEADIWGKKPIVVVSRGAQSAGVTMTGDMATRNLPLHRSERSNMVDSSVDIKVVSKLRAECENIGQLVFSTLLTCRTLLPSLCNVHMVQNLSMSPAAKLELDDTCFLVQLSFQYTMQYIWKQASPKHLLQAVELHVQQQKTDIPGGTETEVPPEAIFS